MKGSALLVMGGLAGTVVLFGQINARAYPGDLVVSEAMSSPASAAMHGGGTGPCGGVAAPAAGKDLVVCRIGGNTGTDFAEYTTAGGISAYAIGTTSCNNGDSLLFWIDHGADADQHPVIAQNLFRLWSGRFEQIGMSWLKHGFCAADSPTCTSCTTDANCDTLQIGCSDVYGSSINGSSLLLGPRSEVNPSTGAFPFPFRQPIGTNAGRLQVDISELDPGLNPGASYFGESQYITPDDAGTANANNNNSYRAANVGTLNSGIYNLSLTGETFQQEPAINAWQTQDPTVALVNVDLPSDGRFVLGYKASNNGDGTWHYEYVLLNMNSHRSAKAFIVPVPVGVTVTNIGFHDVDYHSGDGVDGVTYDGTDWAVDTTQGQVRWFTDDADDNPNANALRWGTLYNFRFDADRLPATADLTITPYRNGTPRSLTVTALAPSVQDPCPWDTNGDDVVGINDFLVLLGAWGSDPGGPPDFDGDGNVGISDLLVLLSRWGPCPLQATCGSPDAGSCFEAHGAPGCAELACCETVCATNPNCCSVAWDDACKDLANTLCGTCGEAAAGDCCSPNGTPGCDDSVCCRAVCEFDPVCCASGWDAVCVGEAELICGCP